MASDSSACRPSNRHGPPSVPLSPTFFVAKAQQQRSKLIKGLLLIGSDRLEDDTVAAIQIGGKHFQYAGGREILLAFADRDCALESDHAPDELRRRSRVQPQLVDNFEFFTHRVQVVFCVPLFSRSTHIVELTADPVTVVTNFQTNLTRILVTLRIGLPKAQIIGNQYDIPD